jgi:hypothetical protein
MGPTVEARFLTGNRFQDSSEPGLVQEDDGSVVLIKIGGTRVPLDVISQAGTLSYDFTAALGPGEVVDMGISFEVGQLLPYLVDVLYAVEEVEASAASVEVILGSGPNLVTDADTIGPDALVKQGLSTPIVLPTPAFNGNPALVNPTASELLCTGGSITAIAFTLYGTLRDSSDFTQPAGLTSGVLRYAILL